MGLSVWRIILIVAVIACVALAVTCHLISLVTDYWLQSSAPHRNNFLNIGLWRACFDHYKHLHEKDETVYDGCHDLYSDVYNNIRDWLVPCKTIVHLQSIICCSLGLGKLTIKHVISHCYSLLCMPYHEMMKTSFLHDCFCV